MGGTYSMQGRDVPFDVLAWKTSREEATIKTGACMRIILKLILEKTVCGQSGLDPSGSG
jgi:hypothetical protein